MPAGSRHQVTFRKWPDRESGDYRHIEQVEIIVTGAADDDDAQIKAEERFADVLPVSVWCIDEIFELGS